MRAKENVTQADAGTSIAGSILVERMRFVYVYIYYIYMSFFFSGGKQDDDALGRF